MTVTRVKTKALVELVDAMADALAHFYPTWWNMHELVDHRDMRGLREVAALLHHRSGVECAEAGVFHCTCPLARCVRSLDEELR